MFARVLRVCVVVVPTLALLGLLLPFALGPWVESCIEDAAAQRLYGTTAFASVELRPTLSATLSGGIVADPLGQPVAQVDRIRVDAPLWRALLLSPRATARIDGFVVDVRREADGRTNIEALRRPKPRDEEARDAAPRDANGADGDSSTGAGESTAFTFPLDLRVIAAGGLVRMHAPDGSATELRDVSFQLSGTRGDDQAAFTLDGDVVGVAPASTGKTEPLGSRGRVHVTGAVPVGAGLLSAFADAVARVELDRLDLAALQPGLALFAPLRAGVRLDGGIAGGLTLEGGALEFTLGLEDARATDAAGAPLDLGPFAAARLALAARFVPEEDAFVLDRLEARLGATRLDARGRASGVRSGSRPFANGSLELHADLDELGATLARLLEQDEAPLGGRLLAAANVHNEDATIVFDARIEPTDLRAGGGEFAATPITIDARVGSTGGATDVTGEASLQDLAVTFADGRSFVTQDVGLKFMVSRRPSALELRRVEVRSRAGTIGLQGVLDGVAEPGRASGTLHVDVDGLLDRLRDDLSGLVHLGLGQGGIEGRVKGAADVTLDAERIGLRGSLDANGLRIEKEFADRPPLRLAEDVAVVTFDASVERSAESALSALDLRRLEVVSALLRGWVSGRVDGFPAAAAPNGALRGEFSYVPDVVGRLLAGWVPGTFAGAEERTLRFDYRGPLTAGAALAKGAGDAHVELGHLINDAIDGTGSMSATLADGAFELRSDLAANGGTLRVGVNLAAPGASDEEGSPGADDVASTVVAPGATLTMDLEGLDLRAGIGDALARLHPMLRRLEHAATGELGGTVSANVTLRSPSALTSDALASGLALERLVGDMTLRLTRVQLDATGTLARAFDELGLDLDHPVDLEPLEARLEGGRIAYEKPWRFDLGSVKPAFEGSVGLDRTLDLALVVPITKKLVKEHGFLERLKGELLRVPLEGTLDKPVFDWSGTIGEVAKLALDERLEDKGLGGVLGGAEDAQTQLEQADALWKDGQKEEAAKLYRALWKRARYTPAVLLAKDRVKRRADWEPK